MGVWFCAIVRWNGMFEEFFSLGFLVLLLSCGVHVPV